jgi:hypothetical protein
VVRTVRTRAVVEELIRFGFSQAEIVAGTGLAKSTIAYHVRSLGRPPDERFNRRYDWTAVQRHYDDGHSVRQCQATFGFSRHTWHAAVNRGDIVPRPRAMPVEELLAGRRSRKHLKRRLLALGLKQERCETCGISDWLGKPLSLALHHINGDGADNRLENLELLCPNCHSQTDNFAGRALRCRDDGVDNARECSGNLSGSPSVPERAGPGPSIRR